MKKCLAILLMLFVLLMTPGNSRAQVGEILMPLAVHGGLYFAEKIGGALINKALEPSESPGIEKYYFEKYEVRIIDGRCNGQAGYIFAAYQSKAKKTDGAFCLHKSSEKDMAEYEGFMSLATQSEKKAYLQRNYWNVFKLDLGYVPEPAKETASAPTTPEKSLAVSPPPPTPDLPR